MIIICPECKAKNEVEFSDKGLEKQNVSCSECNAQFEALNDGSSQVNLLDESAENSAETENAGFDPDNIENMLDQILEDETQEVVNEAEPAEIVSNTAEENDLDNILDSVLGDTDTGASNKEAEVFSNVFSDQSEEQEGVLSKRTAEDAQNSDMNTNSIETKEIVSDGEVVEKNQESEEVEESDEDILNSLKEEMGLDDIFDDGEDLEDLTLKSDEKIDKKVDFESSKTSNDTEPINTVSKAVEEETILSETLKDTADNIKELAKDPKESSEPNLGDDAMAEEKTKESEDNLWEKAFSEQDDQNQIKGTEEVDSIDTTDTTSREEEKTPQEKEEIAEEIEAGNLDAAEEEEIQPLQEEEEITEEIEAGNLDAAEEEEVQPLQEEEEIAEEIEAGNLDNAEEEELQPLQEEEEITKEEEPRKKIGPIPIPASSFGKALMAASLVALIVALAGLYFGFQTIMPEKVAKYIPFLKKDLDIEETVRPMKEKDERRTISEGKGVIPIPAEKANSHTPNLVVEKADNSEASKKEIEKKLEGKEIKPSESSKKSEDLSKNLPNQEKTESRATAEGNVKQPSEKAKPIQSEESLSDKEKPKQKDVGSQGSVSSEDKDVSKALKAALGDKLETDPDVGLMAAISPSEKTITFGTIMPVAYNLNDIRVLSFDLQVEFDNNKTAKLVRKALPVYEKIMVATVEKFLEKKFYNDILYVKEKLQKKLKQSFNKSIKGGRVKKATLKEFVIQ